MPKGGTGARTVLSASGNAHQPHQLHTACGCVYRRLCGVRIAASRRTTPSRWRKGQTNKRKNLFCVCCSVFGISRSNDEQEQEVLCKTKLSSLRHMVTPVPVRYSFIPYVAIRELYMTRFFLFHLKSIYMYFLVLYTSLCRCLCTLKECLA